MCGEELTLPKERFGFVLAPEGHLQVLILSQVKEMLLLFLVSSWDHFWPFIWGRPPQKDQPSG